MPNIEDVAWRFATKLDKGDRRVQCLFCNKKMSGGITRLKEHLANKAGNVSGCPKVSPDVRREMWDLLVNFKAIKKDEEKRVREFEEDIVGSYRASGNENDDNKDDDGNDQLTYSRHQSQMQHETDHHRQYEQNVGGAGGNRLTRNCVDQAQSKKLGPEKQSKISTTWLKKAKKQLIKAWGNFMIDTNIPFRAIESPYANSLMQTIRDVGKGVRDPTAYAISEIYLPKAYNERRNSLRLSNQYAMKEDANYYFKLMKDVVKEIGPHRAIQIVTDNETAVKAGGKKLMEKYPHIYWTPCVAHCLDLLLEDLV
ncbi:uncharacterized protein LOC141641964 [Silene latifolia]|uniref:uncharacterized protein LOC141641964 n=1 Tax=Silene latifolia TaxID=37657 RepID=UPI003D78B00A